MTKRFKILFVLWLSGFVLLALLVLEPILFHKNNNRNVNKVEQAAKPLKVEEDYRSQIKIEFEKVYTYLLQPQKNLEYLGSIRTKILTLRVPTKYRDLHLDLVLALDRMENFEKIGKMSDKNESEKIINRLKLENTWL